MFAIVLMPYAVSEVVGVLTWKILMDPDIGAISRALESDRAWALQLERLAKRRGLALISIISIWHNLPFTFLLLYAGMLAIPTSVYEAAKIDGAGPGRPSGTITLPMMMPAILLAVLFRLVFAFRLFSEVWLLTKGGPARLTEVLAVYLYQAGFRFGDFGVAARDRLDHGGGLAADRLLLSGADAPAHGAAWLMRCAMRPRAQLARMASLRAARSMS